MPKLCLQFIECSRTVYNRVIHRIFDWHTERSKKDRESERDLGYRSINRSVMANVVVVFAVWSTPPSPLPRENAITVACGISLPANISGLHPRGCIVHTLSQVQSHARRMNNNHRVRLIIARATSISANVALKTRARDIETTEIMKTHVRRRSSGEIEARTFHDFRASHSQHLIV